MDARQIKAEELATSHIIPSSAGYSVPSQSGNGRYTVAFSPEPSCTCDDFELRGLPCKHIIAVQIWSERRMTGTEGPKPTEPTPKVKRKTYQQAWPEYNAGQVNEERHLRVLLAELCGTLQEPPHPGRGRKPVPLADQVYAATMKVYSLFSARRFMTALEEAREAGHISRPMHFNSVLNALENAALTPILIDFIRCSGQPLKELESQFAVDSSGFCTTRYTRWIDIKYGVTREKADWVKCHIICGTKTHIITDVTILEKDTADVNQLPTLVAETRKRFEVKEVSGDKAYAASENFDAVDAVGGVLYAAFKKNTTGAVGGIFEKMFHLFCLNREDYLKHYHMRSNVESVFSAVKRKHGDSVRSKTDTAMKNEVLCKLLCHNLCCLIASWYELGIEPFFVQGEPDDDPAILPLVRPC